MDGIFSILRFSMKTNTLRNIILHLYGLQAIIALNYCMKDYAEAVLKTLFPAAVNIMLSGFTSNIIFSRGKLSNGSKRGIEANFYFLFLI